MVMSELQLFETSHPQKGAKARYDALVGLEVQQQMLLDELGLLLDEERLVKWLKKHHPKGLPLTNALVGASSLILLSGEVGCGKTALATSVGTPLATALDRKVLVLETPSNIRGSGLVGEISARVTEAFEQARARAKQVGCALLIIDEADDLVTARDQMQAHHEDRAGVNVLIKQIDRISLEKVPLAVLMITNRPHALDPAVTRRASLHLRFDRPNQAQRRAVMERLLAGVDYSGDELSALVKATKERRGVGFSFSDLTLRLARSALRAAWSGNHPFGPAVLLNTLAEIEPSPLVGASSRSEASGNA
jgi:SpoVK/Ycf46/Vps4 family AAA+-type ATPase